MRDAQVRIDGVLDFSKDVTVQVRAGRSSSSILQNQMGSRWMQDAEASHTEFDFAASNSW